MSYHELSIEERVTIQLGLYQSLSQREIARLISRAPSTVSREVRRNRDATGAYAARPAQQQCGYAASPAVQSESFCQTVSFLS